MALWRLMRSTSIDQAYWRGVIRRGEATFFVGAGVSAPPPSSLPLAAGLVASLIAPVLQPLKLPPGLARAVVKVLVGLRPEVITDVLLEHLGVDAAKPLLRALHGQPNAWHGFLGAALGAGCCIITTNFDTLIEKAGDAIGARHQTVVGTAVEGAVAPTSILFKIHGSLGGGNAGEALSSVALAVRQVGQGLSVPQAHLLGALIEDRPLIVLGYSGRDDFDIRPALLNVQRTAPGLWIVHERDSPIRPLAGQARRKSDARPAAECARAWAGSLDLFAGETSEMLDLLRPRRGFGRLPVRLPADVAPAADGLLPEPDASAIAILYALVEARAFELGTRVFQHATKRRASPRVLVARAVVLEKYGTDLRAAAVTARKARTASKRGPADIRALVLDQSGVIARRRGHYRLALRFYDQALKIARPSKCPEWLLMQIRSHRAVALEYLNRRAEALREHRRVAEYEKRTGDLRGLAKSLNNIGIVHMNQHQWKPAIAALEQSCALKRDLGDHRGVGQSLHNLGKLQFLRGDYASAEKTFLESLRIRLSRGRDEHGAAQSYVALAHVALKAGKLEDAERYATRAYDAHMAFGDQRGITQARGLLNALQPSG
ncbi:MAG TPA: tetratricopeptide repeat protein [Thermoanaerobaculia bacterium]|nr:tetratricopeptide repeat protein [Thermoanaerobaculia bacterium]